ncbi:MAG: hypothetical protein M0Z42_06805, partial [Actinomycetota bacterium]|nr:hypothetical protein [Actinomycetota bacterium]
MGITAFLAAWPAAEVTAGWPDPSPRRADGAAPRRRSDPPLRSGTAPARPVRRIGVVMSEEGGVIASVVIALVAIGLVATLGLSGAAHQAVVLGRTGWHATAGWFGVHRSTRRWPVGVVDARDTDRYATSEVISSTALGAAAPLTAPVPP